MIQRSGETASDQSAGILRFGVRRTLGPILCLGDCGAAPRTARTCAFYMREGHYRSGKAMGTDQGL